MLHLRLERAFGGGVLGGEVTTKHEDSNGEPPYQQPRFAQKGGGRRHRAALDLPRLLRKRGGPKPAEVPKAGLSRKEAPARQTSSRSQRVNRQGSSKNHRLSRWSARRLCYRSGKKKKEIDKLKS